MEVIYQTPKFRKLKRQGLTYVDMHYHTNKSMDSSTHVSFIAKRAKMIGCGVAITDHNVIHGAINLAKKKVMVIPSIEITPSELVDIIPFFYSMSELKEFYHKYIKDYIKPNIGFNFNRVTWKFEEIHEKLEKYNCLITVPHYAAPYPQNAEDFFKKNQGLLKRIHGFEVLNGLMRKDRNKKAQDIAKELNRCFVGGSDGHTLLQLGRVITITENSDIEGFLDHIKNKQNIVMGEELNWSYRKLVQLIIIKNALKLRVKEEVKKPVELVERTVERAERTVEKIKEKSKTQFKKLRK